MIVSIVDYGSGNVRSLINAVRYLGFETQWIRNPHDIEKAECLIFPGVGNFGFVCDSLAKQGFLEPLRRYALSGKPFMAVCVGIQALFEGSVEAPHSKGLGVFPGLVQRFDNDDKTVPHIGWNSCAVRSDTSKEFFGMRPHDKFYFVHSYMIPEKGLILPPEFKIATTKYGNETFVGAIVKNNFLATQFHPEKSGSAGLRCLKAFLTGNYEQPISGEASKLIENSFGGLTKRIIACLDVRSNDAGDLVVTKGDQYDVREKSSGSEVRNLGKPVELCQRYFQEGADEVVFLNITSFRNCPMADAPMLQVLEKAAQTVFVPLTVGGGIRDVSDPDGTFHPAVEVAGIYFRSGADKVSIGSDAVYAAEKYYENGKKLSGKTAIETISKAYGNQAVVISVDPKRQYVKVPEDTKHHVVKTSRLGPNGEAYCWYQCTVKGGREYRDIDVVELTRACEAMGAGEVLLNCMDQDGSNAGYDIELVRLVKNSVNIPVIASSGAGIPQHFEEVFKETDCDAALAAGIFHRQTCRIEDVKEYLAIHDVLVRT
ncbi:imidazoleglycerol-phosphate synthase His4 [Schizosaccharomyces pombe]|uniref:Imidazole glycerol phosphate synthase hisHF n=1 Tax=Schizosaccharomyces pombe (strain 972 / ATCC 24843) TaxID=284812 RepID=HIS5_SCHPO|nr:putative imidazoleglycerol-phosphate synthase [Schizosaccharomyces pombe]O94303.3 RecName: Full=Imidazole glycerol phosphate synthase hisHF; Short=IGP synthase; Short=IGPS; Short=ImGP synthase; Includes: RecName: Full=Glutaminase; Includes: RecName: Full=Cyclase [Schizosaccharomyces pombe 972h-]CAA21905.3 imidazoleglycerol-phosphate synthase (predicted) [Schizosaccharomyces pombe]|eukprot:NP_596494.2 putative imidazoleglycerol-phosphate synthase [Schizosaccharomyces pombe]